jgi:hypothetical protein
VHTDNHGSKKSKFLILIYDCGSPKIEKKKNQIIWPEKLPILLWFFL